MLSRWATHSLDQPTKHHSRTPPNTGEYQQDAACGGSHQCTVLEQDAWPAGVSGRL
jgi:hypothetical protein